MTNNESGQSPMAKAVLCHHGYAVVHRISRKWYSYGRSFSCCPIHWEDPNYCRFFSWDDPPDPPRDEPRAQVPVKQEYMSAPPTASASPRQCPATSSTEDVLQVPPSSPKGACTGPDSSSQEYGRPGPPLSMAQSEFGPARPVLSEEVIQDILDALPAIPIYVRELKRQISTLQETNEMMESRILQLEKQLWENEKWQRFD